MHQIRSLCSKIGQGELIQTFPKSTKPRVFAKFQTEELKLAASKTPQKTRKNRIPDALVAIPNLVKTRTSPYPTKNLRVHPHEKSSCRIPPHQQNLPRPKKPNKARGDPDTGQEHQHKRAKNSGRKKRRQVRRTAEPHGRRKKDTVGGGSDGGRHGDDRRRRGGAGLKTQRNPSAREA